MRQARKPGVVEYAAEGHPSKLTVEAVAAVVHRRDRDTCGPHGVCTERRRNAQVAEAKKVCAIGYHSDMSKCGPDVQLTAVTQQRGAGYSAVARSAFDCKRKQGSRSLAERGCRLANLHSQPVTL